MTDPAPGDLAALTEALRERVQRLERIIMTAYCLLVGAVLVVGSFVPMFNSTTVDSDDEEGWSVARTAFIWMSPRSEGDESTTDTPGVLFGIGFLGLFLVTVLLLLVALPAAPSGTLTGRKLTVSRVLVGLGIAGSLVPGILTVTAIDGENAEPGWGSLILIVGMLATLPVVVPARPFVSRPTSSATRERVEGMDDGDGPEPSVSSI